MKSRTYYELAMRLNYLQKLAGKIATANRVPPCPFIQQYLDQGFAEGEYQKWKNSNLRTDKTKVQTETPVEAIEVATESVQEEVRGPTGELHWDL